MKDASEEEQEEDFIMATNPNKSARGSSGRKSIAERQARLRQMMEDDGTGLQSTADVSVVT
jgi:hypothetical protein